MLIVKFRVKLIWIWKDWLNEILLQTSTIIILHRINARGASKEILLARSIRRIPECRRGECQIRIASCRKRSGRKSANSIKSACMCQSHLGWTWTKLTNLPMKKVKKNERNLLSTVTPHSPRTMPIKYHHPCRHSKQWCFTKTSLIVFAQSLISKNRLLSSCKPCHWCWKREAWLWKEVQAAARHSPTCYLVWWRHTKTLSWWRILVPL